MEIKDFNYRKTPYKKTRDYEVHTLSSDGLNQYLDKNSCVHKFLKSLSPVRQNFDNSKEFENFIYSKYSQEKDEQSDHDNNLNINQSVIKINTNNYNKSIYYKNPDSEIFLRKNNKDSSYYNLTNIQKNNANNKAYEVYENYSGENIGFFEKNRNISNNIENDKKNNKNPQNEDTCNNPFNSNASENVNETTGNSNLNGNYSSNINRNNAFLQTSRNLLCGNRQKQFLSPDPLQSKRAHHRYNSLKYSEDYLTSINSLKKKVTKNFGNNNNSKYSVSPYKLFYGSFKSYDIPNLNYKRDSENFRINLIRNKLESTLLKSANNSIEVNDPANGKDDTCLRNINYRIESENLKLKNYFNNMEKFSTNKNNKTLFPTVSDITNSYNLRTSKLKLMNNKFMGERYNPHNFAQG